MEADIVTPEERADEAADAEEQTNTFTSKIDLSGDVGIKDLRILDQAVREHWNLPKDIFDKLPAAMVRIAMNSKASHRSRMIAAKILLMMHGQNQNDDPAPLRMIHGGTIGVAALRQELLNDDKYLEYCRDQQDGSGVEERIRLGEQIHTLTPSRNGQ